MATPQNHSIRNLQSRGARIMELAEQYRPALMEKLMGCYDENGLAVQPARIRALALIVAQEVVKFREQPTA